MPLRCDSGHVRSPGNLPGALGYQPNGESLHAHPGRVDVLKYMRLLRADWLASGLGDQVEIAGFDACLPLFGLPGR